MENIHSMHYLTKQITDKEICVCFPPAKLYLRTESEVAELAGQTNSPLHQRQHAFQLQF